MPGRETIGDGQLAIRPRDQRAVVALCESLDKEFASLSLSRAATFSTLDTVHLPVAVRLLRVKGYPPVVAALENTTMAPGSLSSIFAGVIRDPRVR
jgi:hypothetical protein